MISNGSAYEVNEADGIGIVLSFWESTRSLDCISDII